MRSANDGRKPTAGQDSAPADAAVVRRVLAGERERYRILIRRYQGRFHRYAVGMVGDPDAATDLVQDSFFRAYTSLESCTEPSAFGRWAQGILRDRCRVYLEHLEDVPDSPEAREQVRSPLGGAEDEEGSGPDWTLRDALACLPGAHREAFLLKHLHGHGYREIAERLGASLDAVEMRVRRSREILRSHLEKKAADRDDRGLAAGRSASRA